MATALTPEQIANKWATNLGGAADAMRKGVLALSVNPMEQAANRQDAYVQGVQRAVSEGRWQAGLRRWSLQQWQQAYITKAIPIIADRALKAKDKFQRFMFRWMAFQATVRAALAAYPRGSLEQNIQRAVFVIRQNAEFGQRGGGQGGNVD